MTAHTFHLHGNGADGNKPMPDSAMIDRPWAIALRADYRRLRMFGVPRSSARSVLVGAYFVGLNAARQAEHRRVMEQLRGAA